jgi:hypothetical protein
MKKLMFIAAVVFMVSCTSNLVEPSTQDTIVVDSMSNTDSVGTKQIQTLDSLSK